MLPVIALVGRPNVGKSTLFNALTRTRNAIVADFPGLTRDRQYGEAEVEGVRFVVIDTGGIGTLEVDLHNLTAKQTQQALEEADAVVFLVDARQGLTAGDQAIAAQMRKLKKPVQLVVNKVDGLDPTAAMGEFFSLGLTQKPLAIAASHGRGIPELVHRLAENFPKVEPETVANDPNTIRFAIVGRPNAGKSTLVNRILGEDRVVVSDVPGTTRDSIFIPFTHHQKNYVMVDTAGLRRRGKVSEKVEQFSIIKTLQAIEASKVVIFMVNAEEGIVEHEMRLLAFIVESGKALVIAINKWDGLNEDHKKRVKDELSRRLHFLDFVDIHYISALHGTSVGNLFDSVDKAYQSGLKSYTTNQLTNILLKAVATAQPPMSHGHRIKLRYAHLGGNSPPVIIIHGNQTEALPESYKRYLANTFREKLKIRGTPIQLQFKTGENPYKDKKNVLTHRQQKKKQRLFTHVKKR